MNSRTMPPRNPRTRVVTSSQVRSYLAKAEEYVAAAADELEAGRGIAATSLAVHAGIDSADVVCGARLGTRATGHDHAQALELLKQAGKDGSELGKELRRLLPMKTKAEYDPDDIPLSAATKAVERARRCVVIAIRVQRSSR